MIGTPRHPITDAVFGLGECAMGRDIDLPINFFLILDQCFPICKLRPTTAKQNWAFSPMGSGPVLGVLTVL